MLNKKSSYTSKTHNFGPNLSRRRRALRLTQADLAERLSLSTETVARFERGTYLPSLPLVAKLSHILGCEPASLLAEGMEGAEPPPHQELLSVLDGLDKRELEHIYEIIRLESHYLRKLRRVTE